MDKSELLTGEIAGDERAARATLFTTWKLHSESVAVEVVAVSGVYCGGDEWVSLVVQVVYFATWPFAIPEV